MANSVTCADADNHLAHAQCFCNPWKSLRVLTLRITIYEILVMPNEFGTLGGTILGLPSHQRQGAVFG